MRTAFINRLRNLAREKENIYLLTGDLGFSVFEDFAVEFSERYINVGICESNMIGIAAGLAMRGKVVYVYSIIPFLTMRCFEQIRNDLCMQNLKVNLIGIGGGLSYGAAGASHHAIEDIGIMRALPNMTVICPGDPYEAEEAVKKSYDYSGTVYIRLNKNNEARLYEKCLDFHIGKSIKIRDGKNISIIATGNMLEESIEIANELRKDNISVNLISMHTIKPLDKEAIKNCLEKTKYIFTIEEHNLIGGLGSAIAEVLVKSNKKYIFKSYGIDDVYADCAGSRDYFRKKYKIDKESIVQDILKQFFSSKI